MLDDNLGEIQSAAVLELETEDEFVSVARVLKKLERVFEVPGLDDDSATALSGIVFDLDRQIALSPPPSITAIGIKLDRVRRWTLDGVIDGVGITSLRQCLDAAIELT